VQDIMRHAALMMMT